MTNVAIKNWFLEKQGFAIGSIKELQKNGIEIAKETERAVLINYKLFTYSDQMWVPKSCLTDEWEHKYSPKAVGSEYHSYLVGVARDAYYKGNLGKQGTFKSGRNVYDYASFIHQDTTKELMEILNKYKVEYMIKAEFAETL